jgi:hypothetical protein
MMKFTIKEMRAMSPEQLVLFGLADPVRVFVKKEPHSNRKIKSGRWRLIFAVSIVDQIIERLLCSKQNKTEILNWETIPSAPGLSLSSDEKLRVIYQRMVNEGTDMAEADVTGWDWSVKDWQLMHEAEMRIKLGNMSETAAHLVRARFVCMSRSVYSFPDGEMRVLNTPGVMKSGCYNTSASNSRLRNLIARLIGASWAFTMGDDCVEEYVENAEEKYLEMGHPLKMYQKRQTEFEFCSTWFTEKGAWPVDGTKTLYRLLEQKKITDELVDQFKLEMRNSPRLAEFLAVVANIRAVQNTVERQC